MKIFTLIALGLLDTVSTVFASHCEDDSQLREKRMRTQDASDNDTPAWLYPHETFDDLSFLGEEAPQQKTLKRQRKIISSSSGEASSSPSSPSSSSSLVTVSNDMAPSFGHALARLDQRSQDEVHKKVSDFFQLLEKYSPYTPRTLPSLERKCASVLYYIAEAHAERGNVAPIAFLRFTADCYGLLGRELFRERTYVPENRVDGAFLSYFTALDLTKTNFKLPMNDRDAFLTSPHVKSLKMKAESYHAFFGDRVLPQPIFPNLTSLKYFGGKTQDCVFLRHLSGLKHLNLSSINAKESPLNPAHFSMLKGLERFKVSYYDLGDSFEDLPEDVIDFLASIPTLKKLSIKDAAGSEAIPEAFGRLTSLTSLSFTTSEPICTDIGAIGTLTNLRSLSLNSQEIESLEPVRHMSHLRYLEARGNELTSLDCLTDMTNLRVLDLRYSFDKSPIETREQVAALARLNLLYLGLMDRDIAPAARAHFDELGVRYSANDMPKTVKRAIKHMAAQDDAPAA